MLFFEKNIYFHKTNLQKNHTYYIQKAENKDKKKLETLKERKERSGVATMSFIQSRIRNMFKLFSLYTFYVIDKMNNL